jgi:pimeloyl-ACP methyl ester carboxylesterase
MKGKGSEVALMTICKPFGFVKNPLCDRIELIKDIPMTFLYGAYDWMSSETAEHMIKEGRLNATCFKVSNSGHHLYVESAEECASRIIE